MRGQRMRGGCHRLPAMMWQQQQNTQIHGKVACRSAVRIAASCNVSEDMQT
jgi:hypothetical protein